MSLFTSSKLIIFLTFLVFIFTGNHLTAEKVQLLFLLMLIEFHFTVVIFVMQVFVTVSLFNNIRLIMTLFFPGAITMAAEARVSAKRIEVNFFNSYFFHHKCQSLFCNLVEFFAVGRDWKKRGCKNKTAIIWMSYWIKPLNGQMARCRRERGQHVDGCFPQCPSWSDFCHCRTSRVWKSEFFKFDKL